MITPMHPHACGLQQAGSSSLQHLANPDSWPILPAGTSWQLEHNLTLGKTCNPAQPASWHNLGAGITWQLTPFTTTCREVQKTYCSPVLVATPQRYTSSVASCRLRHARSTLCLQPVITCGESMYDNCRLSHVTGTTRGVQPFTRNVCRH